MQVQLEVRIAPGGHALTVDELAARIPELEVSVSEMLERAEVSFGGRIVVDGASEDCQREVARHLAALRRLSRELPGARITVASLPDGGLLQLENGSFGDDEEELAPILGTLAERRWQVYVSFRIEADAHPHLLQLVERALPEATPVVDASQRSLAVGFVVVGDEDRVANLVDSLRLAWRQEGSGCECLFEIEGDRPIVQVVRSWADWIALERSIRSAPSVIEAGTGTAGDTRSTVLADVEHTRGVLGPIQLSWIDADDQILCIHEGKLTAITERLEANPVVLDGTGRIRVERIAELRRRADDSLYFTRHGKSVDVPRQADGAERRFHGIHHGGALFSDSAASARTELLLVGEKGIQRSPPLDHVRALDAAADDIYALVGQERVALQWMQVGGRWGRSRAHPWNDGDTPTDVALIGNMRVAVAVTRGNRSALHLVERANLMYWRTLALPCVEPQIVGHGDGAIWVTGVAPSPGPRRCDLFRVEPKRSAIVLMTAELPEVAALDVCTDDDGKNVLVATPRAIHAADGRGGLREVLELAPGEEVTGMAIDRQLTAVFLRGPSGARLVLGRDVVVPLGSPGYEPRFAGRVEDPL